MEKMQQESAYRRVLNTIKNLFALDNINYIQSIKDIKEGVTFKGFNVWILICSILICSLGLNMNSTAVVIGAMLISPLMGPIVGLGLGTGIFDRNLIVKSLKNLGVATVISVLTAYIFFSITPTEEVSELLSRTRPTLLDLFVAFFGGVAGILAAARCLSTNTIPGVAIATALMPPLCTAGFGLAIGNTDYFLGAMFLFILNGIMISLSTLLVVLYLRYPKFSFVDEKTKIKVRSGIVFAVLLVLTPSIYFYYNLLQENLNADRIESFVENEISSLPGVYLNSYKLASYEDEDILHVNVSGNYIEEDSRVELYQKMDDYNIEAKLTIIQPQPIGFKEQRLASLKTDIISELYQNSTQSLKNKDDEIVLLKNEVKRLSTSAIVTDKIVNIVKSQYDIDELAIDVIVYANDQKKDTVPTALVRWNANISSKTKQAQTQKMKDLLQIQLNTDEVRIVPLN